MSSVTDKITDTRNSARPNSTTASGTRSSGGATLACVSLSGWPTASKVHGVTYQIDSSSNPIAGTQLDFSAIVSANSLTSFTVIDGSDTGNSIGDVVEMLPTAAWGQDLADALTAEHNRTGTHKNITTDTITVSSSTTLPAGDIGTADIAAGAITNAKLNTTAGELGGVWLDWTPSFVNLSGGSITYAKYMTIGKTVFFRFKYTLGGAGVAGAVTFSTPTNITSGLSATSDVIEGQVTMFDTGTADHPAVMRWATANTISVQSIDTSGAYAAAGVITNLVPHTWAATDIIAATGFYERD